MASESFVSLRRCSSSVCKYNPSMSLTQEKMHLFSTFTDMRKNPSPPAPDFCVTHHVFVRQPSDFRGLKQRPFHAMIVAEHDSGGIMENIKEDLKSGNFRHVYLLYGDEPYLIRQYRDRLIKALVNDGDTLNFSRFEGKNISVSEVTELGETLPFLSDKRVILLEDTGFFKNKNDEITDYISKLPDYLYLIFTDQQVDRRSRLFKVVKDHGYAAEMKMPEDSTIVLWIAEILKKSGKKITRKDAFTLFQRTGSDMGNIRNELDKLISYTEGRSAISLSDIDAVCVNQTVNRVFDMVRAVADRKQKEAIALYEDLLTLREPSLRILYLMAKQFRQILLTKKMEGEGKGQQEIASALGVRSFVAKNLSLCARSYRTKELEQILSDFVQAEEDVKTGRLNDRMAVEMMIVKCSSVGKEKAAT